MTNQSHHQRKSLRKRSRSYSKSSATDYQRSLSSLGRETTDVSEQYLMDRRQQPGIYTGTIDTAWKVPHGQGTMHYANGSTFTGNWFLGDWSGFGEFECADTNACYQGNFLEQNNKNGLFVVTFEDGRLYDGEYQLDVIGKGVMTFPPEYDDICKTYWGHFDNHGRPHGRGKMVLKDGRQYDGEFVHGEMEGHGRMTYGKDKYTYYLGSFLHGKRTGLGMLVVNEVVVHDGVWHNDQSIEPSRVPSSRYLDVIQPNGTCPRLLGRIPKTLSPCSRLTKNKLTKRKCEKHGASDVHPSRQ